MPILQVFCVKKYNEKVPLFVNNTCPLWCKRYLLSIFIIAKVPLAFVDDLHKNLSCYTRISFWPTYFFTKLVSNFFHSVSCFRFTINHGFTMNHGQSNITSDVHRISKVRCGVRWLGDSTFSPISIAL